MDYIHKRQARHFNVMQLAADDEEGWNVLTGDFVVAGSGSDIVFALLHSMFNGIHSRKQQSATVSDNQ